ncbi:MAG: methionyl-tRNA formyltransferase [Candidatus Nomurabacteria bacterium]|nr:MAG: methionyl-tRNA formyltransferase [Candidatus Nomurabacteria bacterium]
MTKIVFFGNERLVSGLEKTSAPILCGLIERGYDIAAVVSHYTFGKSRNNRELEVAEIAKTYGIPLFTPSKPAEIAQELNELHADIAVLVAYGRIVSQEIIDMFPKGIINIHPSLLPRYRGPTPIEATILNGDDRAGVSIIQLTAGMDEGPIYSQKSLNISGTETKFELYKKIEETVTPLFFEVFPKIIDGTLKPEPQNNNEASYCKLIQKSDSRVDWNKSALEIEREIRTFLGWPQSKTNLGKTEIIITKAHVVSGDLPIGKAVRQDRNTLLVGTSKDLLSIDALKPLGKQEMPISAFLAGYQDRLDI